MENSTMSNSTKNDLIFNSFLEDYYQSKLKLEPINATFTGDQRYNHIFPNNISKEFLLQKKVFLNNTKDQLESFDRNKMNENDQTSYDILLWECNIQLEGMKFPFELTPIDQIWSINLLMGQLASGDSAQPFESTHQYKAWLNRVDEYLIWCDTAIINMREGIRQGITLPSSLIKKVIPQFIELAGGNYESHLFYKPVLNFPPTISQKEQEQIRKDFKEMVIEKIQVQYGKMADFLQNEYLPKGRSSSGVGHYDFGKSLYQHMIRLYTTTEMTAAEIHELGLHEVARIRSEMEKVKNQLHFDGDLRSFFEFVRTNKNLMPFSKAHEVIDNFKAIHQRMMPQLEHYFDLRPKAKFEIRQTEAFRESSASAEYNPPSLDGTRPGVFYVPIPDPSKYNVYTDEDLFLHEAIPGHHYQISLQQENENLPTFRKTLWYSAYGEGWALYCESLGKELGLYTDPFQYFGMLGAEIHRAIRLVVDTGLHDKGWSREEAIQYSLDNEADSEESIISEIERYMAMPGQALSYKIGHLKLVELRKKAESKMGSSFDIKKFHNIVLESGCIPLKTLERKILKWIDSQT